MQAHSQVLYFRTHDRCLPLPMSTTTPPSTDHHEVAVSFLTTKTCLGLVVCSPPTVCDDVASFRLWAVSRCQFSPSQISLSCNLALRGLHQRVGRRDCPNRSKSEKATIAGRTEDQGQREVPVLAVPDRPDEDAGRKWEIIGKPQGCYWP